MKSTLKLELGQTLAPYTLTHLQYLHTIRETRSRGMREVDRAEKGPREGVGGLGGKTLDKEKKG